MTDSRSSLTRLPGRALATAGAVGIVIAFTTGCSAHIWESKHGNYRITSDPPESYPPEEYRHLHPGRWHDARR